MSEATIATLVGLLLGSVLTFLISTVQFNREKAERRKTELREGYKQTWLLLEKYSGVFSGTDYEVTMAVKQAKPGEPLKIETDKLLIPFDQVQLHLLVYVPNGKAISEEIHQKRTAMRMAYVKLVSTNDSAKKDSFLLEARGKIEEITAILETAKAEVIDLIHKLA